MPQGAFQSLVAKNGTGAYQPLLVDSNNILQVSGTPQDQSQIISGLTDIDNDIQNSTGYLVTIATNSNKIVAGKTVIAITSGTVLETHGKIIVGFSATEATSGSSNGGIYDTNVLSGAVTSRLVCQVPTSCSTIGGLSFMTLFGLTVIPATGQQISISYSNT